ncbi:MAG: ATP-binding cassette domain-containing protein [Planctomycetota bacterium]
MNVIEVERVTKTFGTFRAVDDLSFTVPQGCIHGFIGPNGSGKTTTIRMIMHIYHPDLGTGHVRVLGQETYQAANDRIGYLPEERGLYKKMKVREVIRFCAELKGLRDYKQAVQQWLARMDLEAWAEKKVEVLSKGMSQRVQFIAAVIAQPELIILDEPFSGLDPVNADLLRNTVLELRRNGATIIFSTHDMNMAERMCDILLMIHKGKKVLDGTLESIRANYGQDSVRVRMDGNHVDFDRMPGVAKVSDFGRFKELRLHEGTDSQDVLANLIKLGRVTHFELASPSLHEIFVRIAGPAAQEHNHA